MSSTRNPFDLSGRRALITGASRGIGLAVASALTRCGAAVAITGRKADNLTAAASQLQDAGADVRPFVCHQGDPDDIAKLFEQLDQASFAPDGNPRPIRTHLAAEILVENGPTLSNRL